MADVEFYWVRLPNGDVVVAEKGEGRWWTTDGEAFKDDAVTVLAGPLEPPTA